MDHNSKIQKNKRPFPFHLIAISLSSFSENIEAIYFFNILKTLQVQWSLDVFTIEVVVLLSSLAIFLGSYFSYQILSWKTHKFLILSSMFQILFCVLGSFSRNTYEICYMKFAYGLFYGASSKLIILILFLNVRHKIKISNFSLMFLLTSQSFTKMWVFVMMLIYETADPHWGSLWMGNSFCALIFLFIAIFGMDRDAKNSLDHDFIENHSEFVFNSQLKEIYLNSKKFLQISFFLGLLEILNKAILMTLPFLKEEKIFGRIQLITTISGELLGLFIAVLIIVYSNEETHQKKMLNLYISLINVLMLGILLKWNSILWMFLIRIVFATIKSLIYQNFIDKISRTKQLLNLLIIGDFILCIIPFLIFPSLNFESVIFSFLLILSGLIALFSLGLNFSGPKADSVPELEMNLLKIN